MRHFDCALVGPENSPLRERRPSREPAAGKGRRRRARSPATGIMIGQLKVERGRSVSGNGNPGMAAPALGPFQSGTATSAFLPHQGPCTEPLWQAGELEVAVRAPKSA